MTDISTLQIKVDTTAVEKATVALDALTESATKAKAALDALKGYSTVSVKDIGHLVGEKIKDVVAMELRPGGLLAPQNGLVVNWFALTNITHGLTATLCQQATDKPWTEFGHMAYAKRLRESFQSGVDVCDLFIAANVEVATAAMSQNPEAPSAKTQDAQELPKPI